MLAPVTRYATAVLPFRDEATTIGASPVHPAASTNEASGCTRARVGEPGSVFGSTGSAMASLRECSDGVPVFMTRPAQQRASS
mmetsp:Transcript_28864/g.48530  ORF Transcript_28864/g.48530 Transcript_28864/m.48530 type:complete len:83 (-) Transcript_28864:964-1212(-)